jgi:ribosome-binding protein aMBF1 (putative translation factor)
MEDAGNKGRNPSQVYPELRPRGEGHKSSKLSKRDVNKIRKLYEQDGWTQQELAEEFGMSKSAIGQVVRYETWNG